jgi:hypothetical protein
MKLFWTDDLKAESDFRAMNIPFAKKEIRFSQIDLYESSMNGARLGDQIVSALVSDYAQGMRNGDAFPRPVVYLAKKGYILTSGNQRCNAIKELIDAKELSADPMIEVYELETKDKMLLEAVSRAANVSHGGRSTLDERVANAVHMVKSLGMAARDSAKLFMISEQTIHHQIRADKIRKELGLKGVDVSSVPSSTIEHLFKIDNDDGAKTKMGMLIAQHKPTGERVKLAVNRIAKAKSDADRMKVVKTVEAELSAELASMRNGKKLKAIAPKAPMRPRRDKVISTMTRLADFLDFGNDGEGFGKLADLQVVTQADEKTIRDLWARLEIRMALVLKKR